MEADHGMLTGLLAAAVVSLGDWLGWEPAGLALTFAVAVDRLLRIEEASALLGLKPATIRAKILRREWPFVKLGRSVRLRESLISRLILENEVPAAKGSLAAGGKR